MKKKLYIGCFLLMSAMNINAMEEGDIAVSISHHLNYPHCVNELLERLSVYGSQCDTGCRMLALDDPQYLEQYIEFLDPVSFMVKSQMIQEMCIIKCAICKGILAKKFEHDL